MSASSISIRMIDRELRRIEISMRGIVQQFPLNPIPDDLFEALASFVDTASSESISEKLRAIYSTPVTKLTVCTFNYDNPFPINAAVKLARLTLKDSAIEEIIEDLDGRLLALQGLPFEDTVEERIQIYRELYINDSKVDRFRIGAIEIYGDGTYSNLLRDPRVCLNLHWPDPKTGEHRSYQINALTEVVEPGTPYFRFMRTLRSLFSSRFVDSRRDQYVVAYKFWVSEVLDKSLTSKTGFVTNPNSS